jgi:hypothetical protein
MSNDSEFPPLTAEIIARLRAGTASLEDTIAEREHWLSIAKDFGDDERVRELEADLATLRAIEPAHQFGSIRDVEIPEELAVSNLVKQILVDGEGAQGQDAFVPVNSALLTIVTHLEMRLYLVEEKLGIPHKTE